MQTTIDLSYPLLSPTTSILQTRQVAEEMSMSQLIVLKPPEPNSTLWNPGAQGLYPRPKGALSPNTSAWQKSFPLWKVRVDRLKPQQAMFQIADNLSSNACYIAADDWTQRDWSTWGIGKRYGAFSNATDVVTNFQEISQY